MKKEFEREHFHPLVENLIIGAIALVIIHTLVEDFGEIYSWSHTTMSVILVIGFCFDLFFTGEFIGRSIVSKRWGQFGYYFKHQRGWIDALSSIPLLLLVSGPGVIMMILGSESHSAAFGFFSILKTVKAIRVTRILRLIRVLKIFGKIQNTDSHMANRHMGTISTISVVALVIILVLTQFLPFARIGDHHDYLNIKLKDVNALLSSKISEEGIKNYIENSNLRDDIIELKDMDGQVIYHNPKKQEMMHKAYHFGNSMEVGPKYQVILSQAPADALHARANMIIFLSILGVITGIMFFYSRLFVQDVADPVYVMARGFKDWDYNLVVKNNENYTDEEIYHLVKLYNIKWLPLKNQIRLYREKRKGNQEKSSIKMDDIF